MRRRHHIVQVCLQLLEQFLRYRQFARCCRLGQLVLVLEAQELVALVAVDLAVVVQVVLVDLAELVAQAAVAVQVSFE